MRLDARGQLRSDRRIALADRRVIDDKGRRVRIGAGAW
jgi:hypothetical protein